jgi:hypothetical protein
MSPISRSAHGGSALSCAGFPDLPASAVVRASGWLDRALFLSIVVKTRNPPASIKALRPGQQATAGAAKGQADFGAGCFAKWESYSRFKEVTKCSTGIPSLYSLLS